jgi:hypothetical protein
MPFIAVVAVRRLLVVLLALTMKIVLARFAKQHSESTDTPRQPPAPVYVLTVYELKRDAVYNIEVEGEHEYFANGILTHNCDVMSYAAEVAPLLHTIGQKPNLPRVIGGPHG